MVFLTSISPKHILEGRQQECVYSWFKYGEVISFNHPSEIDLIKSQGYDSRIKFVPTWRTQKPMFGKHLVTVNAITDYIKEHNIEYACMINSDIEIDTDKETIENIKSKMKTDFVYLHRFDFNNTKADASIYMDGVDAFFFTPELCETLPQTMYCLGQTYFDIWLPWHFKVMCEKTITTFRDKGIIFHKRHAAQYSEMNWRLMGRYTGTLTGFGFLEPAALSSKIYTTLRTNTNYV